MAAETAQTEDCEPGFPILCSRAATDALRDFNINQLDSFSQH